MGAIAAQARRPRHRHRRQSAQRKSGDDPRGDPRRRRRGATSEIGDRREAIRRAVAALERGDVLLIAGKGHESGQIVGDRVLEFSDHDEVEAALREKVA